MKCIIQILFFISLLGCSTPSKEVKIKEISHGIYESNKEMVFDLEDSPSGNYTIGYDLELKEITDTIPAQVGIKFGFMYQLITEFNQEPLITEEVWTSPKEIVNKEGEKFKEIRIESEVEANKGIYSMYFFEEPFEVIPGEWKFQLFYGGKELYKKSFFVK